MYAEWGHYCMNMIRHDNELIQSVAIIIEMAQRIFDNCAKRWLSKDACAIILVEPVLESSGKTLPIFAALRLGVRFGVHGQPCRSLCKPSAESLCGKRVHRAKSYKIGSALLAPVRQISR